MATDVKKLKKIKEPKEKKQNAAFERAIQKTGEFVRAHVLEHEEDERSILARRRYILSCMRCILGCIFCSLISRGQMGFSIYPFGLAFLCASGRATPIYAASALISALTLGSLSGIYAVAILLIMLMRTLACIYFDTREEGVGRFPIYNEHSAYRIVFSCVAAFTVGIYNLFYGSFSYYSLLGSLCLMAMLPVSSYIFIYALEPGDYTEHRDIARLFLCAVFVWSLRGLSMSWISLADTVAFLLVVTEAKKKKKSYCAIMGLAVGLPFGISGAAIYALSGIVCSLLFWLSETVGCIGAFTFLTLAYGYTGGYGALVSCLGGTSVGLVISLLWYKYNLPERIGKGWLGITGIEERSEKTVPSVVDAAARMTDISHTFSSLSEMLKGLCAYSERSRILDTKLIVEGACDEICSECRGRHDCWGTRASDTADAFMKTAATLTKKRRIADGELPRYLGERCIRRQKLTQKINKRMAEAMEDTLRETGCKLLACDYEAMSRILDSHLEKTKEDCSLDRALSDELTEYCRQRSFGIGYVCVWGMRVKKLYAYEIDLSRHTVSASEMREAFSVIAKTRLSSPVYSIDGAEVEAELHSVPILKARCFVSSLAKDGEGECGDTARYFSNREGYFYSVLCDGMGSGSEAAYTSGIAVEYISNMLEHSNPKELTVEMLNAVLRERSGECSSTVDLFELDTYTGQGCFIKSGAAPSFVCRGKNVYKIAARTIPVGITERIRAEKIKFRLRAGDIVVMASDGIADGQEECRLIVECLCKRTSNEPLDIAAALMSRARSKAGARDDMTLSVISVEEAEE